MRTIVSRCVKALFITMQMPIALVSKLDLDVKLYGCIDKFN
jgi:hypothetical protein